MSRCPRIAQRGCCRANPDLMSERSEKQPGKEAMRLYAEKQACPRRRNPTTLKTVLSCRQSERDGKAFWDAEQSDCHPPSCERTRIASQPLCPRKSRVCTLGTRKGRRRDGETGGGGRPDLDLDALMAHQLDACPSVVPTTPVTEDEW